MAQHHETPLARRHGGSASGVMRRVLTGTVPPRPWEALRLGRAGAWAGVRLARCLPAVLPNRTIVRIRPAADRAKAAARGACAPAGLAKVTFQPHGAPQPLQPSFPTQPLAVRILAAQPALEGGAARVPAS